jgi:beta-lactamase regulating signal transducer with metallopeptidase domain
MGLFFEASLNAAWTQLWQVTLLVLAVWLTVRYTARNRPHLASVLWLVVLIKSVTPPLWSSPSSLFSWLQASSPASEVLHTATTPVHQASTIRNSVQVAGFAEDITDLRDPVVSKGTFDTRDTRELPFSGSASNITSLGVVVLMLWMLGCLGFVSVACLRGILCWSRLRRAGTVESPEVAQLAANLSLRLGLKWPVKVIVTCCPVGPAVIGLVRPTVVLPSLIAGSKALAELELLLAHELIHVRRGDLWVGLLQAVSQAVWWFHPLVWMANRQLTREAERCCDEEVIACLGCEPGRYARSLVDVLALKLSLRTIPVFPGVRPVDVTSQRLERIMSLRHGCHKRTPYWCWLILLLTVSATLPGAALVADGGDEPFAEMQSGPPYADLAPKVAVPVSVLEESVLPDEGPVRTQSYPVEDLVELIKKQLKNNDIEARAKLIEIVNEAALPPNDSTTVERDGFYQTGVTIPRPVATKPVMTWTDKTLNVQISAKGHARIATRLNSARKDGFSQVQLEVIMVTSPVANLDRFPNIEVLDSGAAEDDPETWNDEVETSSSQKQSASKVRGRVESVIKKHHFSRMAIVNSVQVKTFLEKAQSNPHTNVLHCPKVTVINGHRAEISDRLERPFVVAMHRAANGQSKPIVRFFHQGVLIRLRPRLLDERDQLYGLRMTTALTEITDVNSKAYPTANGQPAAMVQIPEVSTTKIDTTLELKSDQTLVIGDLTVGVGKDREPFMLLISLKRAMP